jgi:hypothetical protein
MITQQFQEKIKDFQNLLQEDGVREFIAFVRFAASCDAKIISQEHLQKGDAANFLNFTVASITKSGRNILSHGDVIQIATGSEKFRQFLLLQDELFRDEDSSAPLLDRLSALQETINVFFKSSSDLVAVFNLIMSAQAFIRMLDTLGKGFRTAARVLQPEMINVEGQAEIVMYLEDEVATHSEVLTKLQSIQLLYSEICQLLNVSEIDFPLRIVKIETGSLWAKVFGESKVVELLTQCCANFIDYLYRTYTNEGQLASISKKVESVESILQLEASLAERGYDVSEMREPIQKASQAIAASLQELTKGQSKVRLNDKAYTIGSAKNSGRFLKGKEQAQLSPAAESNDEESTMDGEIVADD